MEHRAAEKAREEILMPKAFMNCVRSGGRVRRKKLSGGRYINLCFRGGKSYAGEAKKAKRK